MADRIGNYNDNYPILRESDQNDGGNVILDSIPMPKNGWVEKFGVKASSFGDAPQEARLVAYRLNDKKLLFTGGLSNWDNEFRDREANSLTYIQVYENETILVGFWRPVASNIKYRCTASGEHRRFFYSGGVPDELNSTDSNAVDALGCWLYFTPNERPTRGVWRSSTPSGPITNTSPSFSGTIPHPEGLSREKSVSVRLRIWNKSTGSLAKQEIIEPSVQENSQGYFDVSNFYTHTFGKSYYAEFEHQDTFGSWSEPSNRTHYEIVAGPQAPFLVNPVKNSTITAVRPAIKGTYLHPLGTGINRARFRIWNAQGTVIIKDSGLQTFDSFDSFESIWTLNSLKGVTSLLEGTRYGIDLQTEDTSNITSPWSVFETFKTNEKPYRPTDLFPSQSQSDFGGKLRGNVGDPDGDTITKARFWIYKPDGTTLTGWNQKEETLSTSRADLSVAESTSFASVAVQGTTYTWKMQVFDGDLWSEISTTQRFTYAQSPVVTALYPAIGPRNNKLYPVSPNYDNSLTGVTLSGTDTGKTVEVVDDIAASGETGKAWLVKKTSAGNVRFGPNVEVAALVGERWVFGVATKRLTTGRVGFTLRIECFNASNTLLSTIDCYNKVDIPSNDYWDYDASISTDLPTGTTKIKAYIYLPNTAETGDIRVDAWMLQKAETAVTQLDFYNLYRRWFGPFSGDTDTFGGEDFENDFRWDGTPGYSQSVGIPILEAPSGRVILNYTHPNGTVIYDKRIVVQKWYKGAYAEVYDSGSLLPGTPADYSFTFPSRVIQNEARYRLKLIVKDNSTAKTEASTGWIPFDVSYPGPPELEITQVATREDSAQLHIEWTTPGTNALEFFAYEVAIESEQEGEVVFAQINTADRLWANYHFPISGRDYVVKARQITLQDGELVASRWSGENVRMDYSPRFFLKNMNDPREYVVFEPGRGQLPTRSDEAPIEEYLPLFNPEKGGPNKGAPIQVIGPHRYNSGSFQMTLWPEDDYWNLTQNEIEQNMKAIARGPRFACFLSHLPPAKNFVVIKSIGYSTDEVLDSVIDIEWTDARFEEDIFIRGDQRYTLAD